MSTTQFVLLLLSITIAVLWLRSQQRAALSERRYLVLAFLVLQSRESNDVLGVKVPRATVQLRRSMSLCSPPSPGIELDGIGTEPVKIFRVLLEENSKFHAYLHLDPVIVPLEQLEPYARDLVADCGWEIFCRDPLQQADGPNKSIQLTPDGAADFKR